MSLIKQLSETAKSLHVTPTMLEHASDLGMRMIVVMNPSEFLTLTTTDDTNLKKIVDGAKTLDEYNQLAELEKSTVMPFLYLDDDGKITGYEGRHRAAALHESGVDRIPVSIHLTTTSNDLPDHIWSMFPRGAISSSQVEILLTDW